MEEAEGRKDDHEIKDECIDCNNTSIMECTMCDKDTRSITPPKGAAMNKEPLRIEAWKCWYCGKIHAGYIVAKRCVGQCEREDKHNSTGEKR